MSTLGVVLSASMLAQTVRSTVPYACAALGGAWSERSGVVNIALEGKLLVAAFASVAAAHASGSAWVGVLAGVASGALVGLLHAAVSVWGRVDAIVSGVAINMVALGGTRALLRALYASSSNSPAIDAFGRERAGAGAAALVGALTDPLVVLAIVMTLLTVFVHTRTRFGLRLRASGEAPDAAAAAGVRVRAVRTAAVVLGGAVAGLGGVALSYEQHQFQSGMSGGRGFIALAAVIVAGWRPGRATLACAFFAALDALQLVLQTTSSALRDVLQMLPYVATLVVLAVLSQGKGRAGPPAGLGVPPPEE